MTTKVIRVKPEAPWFDSEYQNLRRKRRKAEKIFRKTKTEQDKNEYIKLRKETTKVAKDKKINLIKKRLKRERRKRCTKW